MLTLIALIFAIVVPNLGTFVPTARLQGSGNNIRRTLDWLRSEARIQGRRMAMDLDLDRGQWRVVLPPEEHLTRDQEAWTIEERPEEWESVETDVKFAGAGDARNGLVHRGVYRIVFDEYGFTSDQTIVLQLVSDPAQVWSLDLLGLSGRMAIETSDKGDIPTPTAPLEGAF